MDATVKRKENGIKSYRVRRKTDHNFTIIILPKAKIKMICIKNMMVFEDLLLKIIAAKTQVI